VPGLDVVQNMNLELVPRLAMAALSIGGAFWAVALPVRFFTGRVVAFDDLILLVPYVLWLSWILSAVRVKYHRLRLSSFWLTIGSHVFMTYFIWVAGGWETQWDYFRYAALWWGIFCVIAAFIGLLSSSPWDQGIEAGKQLPDSSEVPEAGKTHNKTLVATGDDVFL
jgi:hypothetical protein